MRRTLPIQRSALWICGLALLLIGSVLPISGQERTPPPTVPPPAITPLRLPTLAPPLTPPPLSLTPRTPTLPTPTSPFLAPVIPAGAPPTPTPEAVFPLRPGTVEGALNAAVPVIRYRFEAAAEQSVLLRMETTSGALDPVLTLLDANGTQIARNDDAASGDRSAQIALTLSAGGAYTVIASSFVPGAGTFRLALTLTGDSGPAAPADPLAQPPAFGVPFTIIDDQEFTPGLASADGGPVYYAIAGRQGDLIRAIAARTSGDLEPALNILDAASQPISRAATGASATGEAITTATLPAAGWYLIEVTGTAGAGTYDLYVTRLAAAQITVGDSISGTLLPNAAGTSYLIDARMGDLITLTMFMTDITGGGQPRLTLLDLSLTAIARADGQRFATLRATAPRSGLYIVQVENSAAGTFGTYALRFTRLPQEVDDFAPIAARYNEDYTGAIPAQTGAQYYRFTGKTDELVTLTLTGRSGDLDPLLLLLDSDLNELAAARVGVDGSARIVQFRLPKDGDYLIVAGREGLAQGSTSGDYQLAITAGAIVLEGGAFTATLTWAGQADLNLFVTDPGGQPVSWSAPETISGGRLQIDANTRCETISAQPIEHTYWPTAAPGDYVIWVWAQNACGAIDAPPTPFTLTLTAGGLALPSINGELLPGQRYETTARLTSEGAAVRLDEGVVTRPTPQQQASEGGDLPIRYGEALTGTLTGDRYALFYQFTGAAGDTVTLTAERVTGDLDPVLAILDPAGALLAENDDADAATRTAQLIVTLPTAGRYVIAVTRYGVRDGTTTGDFRLTLTRQY